MLAQINLIANLWFISKIRYKNVAIMVFNSGSHFVHESAQNNKTYHVVGFVIHGLRGYSEVLTVSLFEISFCPYCATNVLGQVTDTLLFASILSII